MTTSYQNTRQTLKSWYIEAKNKGNQNPWIKKGPESADSFSQLNIDNPELLFTLYLLVTRFELWGYLQGEPDEVTDLNAEKFENLQAHPSVVQEIISLQDSQTSIGFSHEIEPDEKAGETKFDEVTDHNPLSIYNRDAKAALGLAKLTLAEIAKAGNFQTFYSENYQSFPNQCKKELKRVLCNRYSLFSTCVLAGAALTYCLYTSPEDNANLFSPK